MDVEKTLDQFALFAGLSFENAEEYRPLCSVAAAQLAELERPGLNEAEQELVSRAAGALAFYRWALLNSANGAGFSVGDVRAEPANGVNQAREIWREYRAAAARCLKDGGFVFQRVRP